MNSENSGLDTLLTLDIISFFNRIFADVRGGLSQNFGGAFNIIDLISTLIMFALFFSVTMSNRPIFGG